MVEANREGGRGRPKNRGRGVQEAGEQRVGSGIPMKSMARTGRK